MGEGSIGLVLLITVFFHASTYSGKRWVEMARKDVRITESLRVKIGEAKNLLGSSSSGKATYCVLYLDREEIYRTAIVEKSQNPFYGEEFHGEIPKQFRYLSCTVLEKPEKVLGKVTIRQRDLHKYHNKEHWFPLLPIEAHNEVQGKVHLEIRFDEYLRTDSDFQASHRLAVRVVECTDLSVVNGACNPYAVVTLSFGKVKSKDEVKRTVVKKKTICPQFEETFFFDIDHKGQNQDGNQYVIEDIFAGSLCVSLWHDDSRVAREVLGGIFPGVFLGEVRIPLSELDSKTIQNAWYFLRPKYSSRQTFDETGAIRLKVSFTTEHVFLSHVYDDLRNVLLQSTDIKPVSSSSVCILGQVVDNLQEAAQPLIRVFLHHGKIVPLIEVLAQEEIQNTADSNTLFRGNTLLTKMVDELMKIVGLPYLKHTLKPVIEQICSDNVSCEIDITRLRDGEDLDTNMDNLRNYIKLVFDAITSSGLLCPTSMSQVFFTLKQTALNNFPDNNEVKYQVISGFIFLRFFAPAILGPRYFDLISDTQDPDIHRTLTLISKAIQGLGNLASSKSWSFGLKEEYMIPLFKQLADSSHTESIKMYLDIISSSTKAHSTHLNTQEVPIVLKEGMLIKRAQGRRKFGRKNFKQRYFMLTNESLSYSKFKGGHALCVIPIEDILAVESLQEQSFKMKYMFQIIQPQWALYVQACNCIEEKEWLDVLNKVIAANKHRLQLFHPAAFINGHWLCCKEVDSGSEGCTPVSTNIPFTEIKVAIDSDREIERIHALFLNNMDRLEALQDACGELEVYSGGKFSVPLEIEDTKSCFETINEILKFVIGLEQEHLQYRKMMQKETVKGSFETPHGDDSILASPSTTKL